ncbi:MAG: ribosome small subunit-dependent GTPase A [Bacteroidota bacterium]
MQGVVYKSTGSWYLVKTAEQNFVQARIKGKFKIDGITSTNPIAVGDEVGMEMDNENEKVYIISTIHQRRNYINRQSPHRKHQQHIVAANLDQTLLFATLREPRTSQGFIDRFLITSEAYHLPGIIVFNKSDIYRQKELDLFDHLRNIYANAGYKVFLLSMNTMQGFDLLVECLHNRITLISGHSGVGKSTFINALLPGLDLRTENVSSWSGKGMHTTTFAEMFDLPSGGAIIDTPGVKEFGLVDISRQELSHYFPEMLRILPDCQFNNCLHLNEPGCAVKDAVRNGLFDADRYISYCTILDSIDEKKY